MDSAPHERAQNPRKPVGEQLDRGGADATVGLGIAVVPLLVFYVVALEFGVVGGDVTDAHPLADLAPEVEHRELFPLAHLPPAEASVPADRLVDEGREDVEEILVGDFEPAMLIRNSARRPRSL